MKKIRIAVLVSGGGTNLQALINAFKKGMIKNGTIELVISSNKNAYAIQRAEKAGIPTCVVERKGYSTQLLFENALDNLLSYGRIDLIVLAGFMCILSKEFTLRYPKRIINIHPSLIPSFCGKGFYGLRVHEAAIERGVKLTGATVHYVNEIPDGGEIIIQKAVGVRCGDTPEILQKRVMRQAEWKILPLAVEEVCSVLIEEEKKRKEREWYLT